MNTTNAVVISMDRNAAVTDMPTRNLVTSITLMSITMNTIMSTAAADMSTTTMARRLLPLRNTPTTMRTIMDAADTITMIMRIPTVPPMIMIMTTSPLPAT
ncbi:MAG: hypothetical protein IT576_07315 [Verrucomicrobiales bacterium]|nr:hypothetical protein [Verrucomicrobiales bacterium]